MKREHIFRIFTKIPELQTDRLVLRRLCLGDAADMFEYACREDVTTYLTWSPHPNVAYTKEYLSCIEKHSRKRDTPCTCAKDHNLFVISHFVTPPFLCSPHFLRELVFHCMYYTIKPKDCQELFI